MRFQKYPDTCGRGLSQNNNRILFDIMTDSPMMLNHHGNGFEVEIISRCPRLSTRY